MCQPLSQNQLPVLLLFLLFQGNLKPQVRVNQVVNEHSVDRAYFTYLGHACCMNRKGHILVYLRQFTDETPVFRVERKKIQKGHCVWGPHVADVQNKLNSITTLVLKDQPKGYVLSYFYRSFKALYFQNIWSILPQICIYHHGWEKDQIYGVLITGKCICKSKYWI